MPDAECPYKLEPSNTTLKDYENVTGEYHKGEPCPYSDIDLCQEGYCQRCQIYRDYAGKLGWEADDATLTADQQ